MLSTTDVGRILGEERQDGKTGPLPAATVRQYLADSKPPEGRYQHHPFPAPAGRINRSPVWTLDQEAAIREWARTRLGAGFRKDLLPKTGDSATT